MPFAILPAKLDGRAGPLLPSSESVSDPLELSSSSLSTSRFPKIFGFSTVGVTASLLSVADKRGFLRASARRLERVGMLFRVATVGRFLADKPLRPGEELPLTPADRADRGAGEANDATPRLGPEAMTRVLFVAAGDLLRFCEAVSVGPGWVLPLTPGGRSETTAEDAAIPGAGLALPFCKRFCHPFKASIAMTCPPASCNSFIRFSIDARPLITTGQSFCR